MPLDRQTLISLNGNELATLNYYLFRMLVYEYVDNGNLEQWLHGDVGPVSPLTWDIRMKIATGTAKGCGVSSFFFSFSSLMKPYLYCLCLNVEE